mmetsp:Transcript_83842/g.132038  ORF Transcript_83842/g.132038 Transcript_83842/m.132038 type:complete len:234 (-) Transcript_83842:608-1309(-)
MSDFVMTIHEDGIDDLFCLIDTIFVADNFHFVLLFGLVSCASFAETIFTSLRYFWHLDFHFRMVLDSVDNSTPATNDVWDARRMDHHTILREVVEGQLHVAFLDQLFHCGFGERNFLSGANDSHSVAHRVDFFDFCLFLDLDDVCTFWAYHATNLALWNLDHHRCVWWLFWPFRLSFCCGCGRNNFCWRWCHWSYWLWCLHLRFGCSLRCLLLSLLCLLLCFYLSLLGSLFLF